MHKILHKAETRGHVDHGWLESYHTFSFAHYHNSNRMNFGALRVLNDDTVQASQGFDTHPHQDMEIVSIPLKGSLRHKDSEGNEAIIGPNEVQLMSAGTGVLHSEYNHSSTADVNFLQIWILPQKLGIKPRYDQQVFDPTERKNQFQLVVSPLGHSASGVKINQRAFFSLADIQKGESIMYQVNEKGHGVYFFVIEGNIKLANETLLTRDALGLNGEDSLALEAQEDSRVLAIEVPRG